MIPHVDRRPVIEGLRALADLLDSNPRIPAPRGVFAVRCVYRSTDEEAAAEIDRIAGELGTETALENSSYHTQIHLGPVRFKASAMLLTPSTLQPTRYRCDDCAGTGLDGLAQTCDTCDGTGFC
ncbi:zinc finger-like domain-containing protein [Sinosporangium siamense]|uniref:Uncharacterized protein n=1 Tax=Sinosporangium siamense TaxID=1367973 RepID=A0A919RLA4_9ACTN|nr:zinc finger-like domain-containing protein [Sinosporangium siamense]GII94925.1 hypothetical protein Ssi02_51560 [Sinosporangium siamense]